MASAEFDESIEEKRPTVQVGDPFTEKCLLEACLELMQTGAVIAIQDMGAAGLTCSAVEMGAKGSLGIELRARSGALCAKSRHDRLRDDAVGKPGAHADGARARQGRGRQGDLPSSGASISPSSATPPTTLRFRVKHQGEEVANLPIKELGDDGAGIRPAFVARPRLQPPSAAGDVAGTGRLSPMRFCSTWSVPPNHSSRRWVYEQYDTLIQGNSLQLPGRRCRCGARRRPRQTRHSPSPPTLRRAMSRPTRSRAASRPSPNAGATSRQPARCRSRCHRQPELRQSRTPGDHGPARRLPSSGIGEACRALDFPIVSGNVSLYNETQRPGRSCRPRPSAALACSADWSPDRSRIALRREGETSSCSSVAGRPGTHLGQSVYLRDVPWARRRPCRRRSISRRERKRRFRARSLITRRPDHRLSTTCSSGGLALALAEMAMASGIGANGLGCCRPRSGRSLLR